MRVEIPGPVGTLVGELESPAGKPLAQALVCHPHPSHGGSLRNSIVVRVARALREAGLVTLRFNFRGVEGSEGQHDGAQEVEDAAAAAAFLSGLRPELPLWMAGYSFGSRITVELARRDDGIERVLLIAYPCRVYSPAPLAELRPPGWALFGSADPFGTASDLRARLPSIPPTLEVVEIEGADHLFRGRTPLVEEEALRYARSALPGRLREAPETP